MNTQHLLDILSFLGIPTILLSLIGLVWRRVLEDVRDTKAVQKGVQALLRDRLYQQYTKAMEKGYASITDKENFQNCYTQYHELGTNGVMDRIYQEYMELPTFRQKGDV